MSAGLATSTVAFAIAPPLESFTVPCTPAVVSCAIAPGIMASARRGNARKENLTPFFINPPLVTAVGPYSTLPAGVTTNPVVAPQLTLRRTRSAFSNCAKFDRGMQGFFTKALEFSTGYGTSTDGRDEKGAVRLSGAGPVIY